VGVLARSQFPRRALCLAVALLLPASFMAAQAQPESKATSAKHQTSARAVIPAPSGVAPAPVNAAARPDRPAVHQSGPGRVVLRSSRLERISAVSADSAYDVPLVAVNAYQFAAAVMRRSAPTCHLSWTMVAAIGAVESDHGRFGGAEVLTDGTTSPRIVGVPLDGRGSVAKVRDTDHGKFDGDVVWDRAVGPLQFLPSTWAIAGVDADQDGVRNPFDFNDAALAAASYLCAGAVDMRVRADARAAVYRYNHSQAYVDAVLSIAAAYDRDGLTVVSDLVLPQVPELLAPHSPPRHQVPASNSTDSPTPRPHAQSARTGGSRSDKGTGRALTARHAGTDRGLRADRQVNGEEPARVAGVDVPRQPQLPVEEPIDQAPQPPADAPADQAPQPPADAPADQAPQPPADAPADQAPQPPADEPADSSPEPPGDEPGDPQPPIDEPGDPSPEPPGDEPGDPQPPIDEPGDPSPELPGPPDDPKPTPGSPTPEPTPPPGSPTPDLCPVPEPESSPGPEPEPVRSAGVLTMCDDSWWLDDVLLDLGDNPDLSLVQADYDGDTVVEPVIDELTALIDSRVRVLTEGDGGLVLRINRLDYVAQELPADSASEPTAPPADDSTPTPTAPVPTD